MAVCEIRQLKNIYTCTVCNVAKDGTRLPLGWKSPPAGVMCGDCFRDRYIIRAVTLPVGCPVGSSWDALRPALHDCWRLSTDAANWAVQQLFRLDTPGEPKLPEAVKGWYAYGAAKESYPGFATWEGGKSSLNIVLRGVQRKYTQHRFDVMVRRVQSLLTYRYPYPYPVDADGWTPGYEPGDFPAVSLTLPGIGPVRLRLKRRADFGRQLAMFRQLHQGAAIKAEAALYENRKGDILVKLVGWFPRLAPQPASHTLLLHRDPAAFLVAQIDGCAPWILNCDHLRRRQAAHRTYLQRLSEDSKREKRLSRRQRDMIDRSRAERCAKHRDRMATAIHEMAAQVARYCARQKVALVAYDETDRGYFREEKFPWFEFKTKLKDKLDALGIEWFDDQSDLPVIGGLQTWRIAKSTAQAGRLATANARRKGSHPAVSSCPAPKRKRSNVSP